MKKLLTFMIITLLLTGCFSTINFTENVLEKNVFEKNENQTVEVKAITRLFKKYIPLRETFEGLGYTVEWQEHNQMVEITKGNESVYVKTGEKYFLRNGVLVNGEETPIIKNRRMYLSTKVLDKIFESAKDMGSNSYRIKSELVQAKGQLPKLKDKDEYEKLMSFYPNNEIVYMTFDGNVDFVTEPMVEESAMEMTTDTAAKSGVSETNNQVDGVDEADIVKIDENYIYALRNNILQIIKTGRAELQVIHTIEENGFTAQQLFVKDDKLVLIGNEVSTEVETYEEGDRILTVPLHRSNVLMVKAYDISDLDKKAPKLIKSFGVEGFYVSARLVDDYVYVVADQHTYYGDVIQPMFLETDATNTVKSTEIGFEDVAYFPGHVNNSLIYTMGIDLNNLTLDGLDVDTYVGGGNTIYADKDNLYLALQANSGMWWGEWNETTDIFSFDLNKGKIDFKAKGSVPGYILNQFSMDEYNNHFRIATTRWGSEDLSNGSTTRGNTTLNRLYILNDKLEQVGATENLAPGERIYSTRMIGEKVYMVTYRQVDPFYVIDTSDPTKPDVLGYLKIPGYSSYLHPYDENTIIGVGMETKMKGDRVVNDGVKISLFDVSDFNNPTEKDKVILGTGNSSTDIGYDHKAFLFNKTKNILAIPVRMVNEDYTNDSKDAYIFNFTKEGMLNFRGAITHGNAKNKNGYYEYNNSISRIMYDGNDLYTLSNNWLKLNDFDSLNEVEVLRR